MEFREDTVVPIRVWQDEIMGVSFIDVLGKDQLYAVKLPSTIEKYRFGHLINPEYLLDIELVKTRKNWVLKNVSIHQRLTTPTNYDEHIKLSEMIKTIAKLSYSEQESGLQKVLLHFLSLPLLSFDLSEFEAAVLDAEGFLENQETSPLTKRVDSSKKSNDLV